MLLSTDPHICILPVPQKLAIYFIGIKLSTAKIHLVTAVYHGLSEPLTE